MCQWQTEILSGAFYRLLLMNHSTDKALLSSTDYYSPFEKYLLAYYYVLADTECLTMGFQVTMQPLLSIMNWVLSDPSGQILGMYSNTSS